MYAFIHTSPPGILWAFLSLAVRLIVESIVVSACVACVQFAGAQQKGFCYARDVLASGKPARQHMYTSNYRVMLLMYAIGPLCCNAGSERQE